jgi:hypothetical protein
MTMTDGIDSNLSSLPAPVFSDVPQKLRFEGPRGPLFKAMAEARKHFKSLNTDAKADVTNKEGKFLYSFKYSPLDVVLDALEPGLSAAGIALMQPFDGDTLYTIVACGDSSMTVETPLPQWDTPQHLGSLLTYLRRYQVKGVFGVADSEDDDGNAASGNTAGITRKEPTTAKAPVSTAHSDAAAAAKSKGMSGAEFAKLVFEQTGNAWKDCNEADARKVLKAVQDLVVP